MFGNNVVWMLKSEPSQKLAELNLTRPQNNRYGIRSALEIGANTVIVIDDESAFTPTEILYNFPAVKVVYLYLEKGGVVELPPDLNTPTLLVATSVDELPAIVEKAVNLQDAGHYIPVSIDKLIALCHDSKLSVDDRLFCCVCFGLREFGLDLGIVAQIDGSKYTVKLAHSANPEVESPVAGVELDANNTYCDITRHEAAPVAIHHMRNSSHAGHPCYSTYGLESYIAAPLWDNGKVVGTINFSAAKPRKAFSTKELALVAQLGDLTSNLVFMQTHMTAVGMDYVTGLKNRSAGEKALSDYLVGNREEVYTLLFMDLDRFKIVNDQHGHIAGDAVLREIAKRLRSCVRSSDMLFRWGGDEFVMLLPKIENTYLENLLDRLYMLVTKPVSYKNLSLKVGISIGVAHSDELDANEDILEKADRAMYDVKQRKSGIVVAINSTS